MARPLKEGLDYFPLNVDIDQDDKVAIIETIHGIIGFGIVIKLLMKVYSEGYFYKWGEKEQILFSKRVNVDINEVNVIINDCVKWALFDEELFKDHNILTSTGIQRRYAQIAENAHSLYQSPYRIIHDNEIPKHKTKVGRVRMYNYNVKEWCKIMEKVFKRDGYTCQYCSKIGGKLEVDHIIPFSKGGSDKMDNLTTACRKCNRMKRDKSVSDFLTYMENKGGFK